MIQLLGEHTAGTGSALPQQIPTGEVVATVASDAQRVGGMYDVFARFTGAVVAYVIVAVILLRISVPLGLLVLIGVPIVTAGPRGADRAAAPPPGRAARARRAGSRPSAPTPSPACGCCGGSAARRPSPGATPASPSRCAAKGVRVAGVQSVLDAAQVFLPGVFVVLITWIGARFAIEGRITAGRAGRGVRLRGLPGRPAGYDDRDGRPGDPRVRRGAAGHPRAVGPAGRARPPRHCPVTGGRRRAARPGLGAGRRAGRAHGRGLGLSRGVGGAGRPARPVRSGRGWPGQRVAGRRAARRRPAVRPAAGRGPPAGGRLARPNPGCSPACCARSWPAPTAAS